MVSCGKHHEDFVLACPDCHKRAQDRVKELEIAQTLFALPEEITEAKRALDAIRSYQAHIDREVSTIHMLAMTFNERLVRAEQRLAEMQKVAAPATVDGVRPMVQFAADKFLVGEE